MEQVKEFLESVLESPEEEIIGGIRALGDLPDERAVFCRRQATNRIYPLDEGGVGKDAWAFRAQCLESHPRDGVGVHGDGWRHHCSEDDAATVALPPRARKMGGHDIAVVIEQRGVGYGASPTDAIPRVDLKTDAEAVEVDLVGVAY